MATREQVYSKFGLAAEAAQLFETDLGTMALALEGWKNQWHLAPDATKAAEFYERLNRKTLGQLLDGLTRHINFDEAGEAIFHDGLAARNQLFHGFYERHGYRIQTDEGRNKMMADLERLHTLLFDAWQAAQQVAAMLTDTLYQNQQ